MSLLIRTAVVFCFLAALVVGPSSFAEENNAPPSNEQTAKEASDTLPKGVLSLGTVQASEVKSNAN